VRLDAVAEASAGERLMYDRRNDRRHWLQQPHLDAHVQFTRLEKTMKINNSQIA